MNAMAFFVCVQQIERPLKRGLLRAKELLLLFAFWLFLIFFFGAVDFLVVHFAAAMAASESGCRNEHES